MPIKEIADQNFEEIPTQEEKAVKEEKYLAIGNFKLKQKFVLASGGVLTILLILLILFLAQFKQPVSKPEIPPFPSPSPTPVEEKIASPSAYATDSAILKIEEDLKTLDQDLQSTDLKETGLNPPALDWEVEF